MQRLGSAGCLGYTHWKVDKLAIEFHSTPYEPYWAIKQQLLRILSKVNHKRKTQGLSQLPYRVVLGMKRKQIRVFLEGTSDESEAA